ncbi:MAG TPA: NAD(P)/FAD-dependent oxidoreductase [Candidatus Polarisedimenticolia bacterium]|nr:NAD(P)/FAD-dependent oxidoreductase [Candidatus Polarisedimenticolia bacterium]
MGEERIYELAVVGGGIGGAACALRAAQYNLRAAWVLGDGMTGKRSRGRWVVNVDNMIGVHPDLVLDQLRETWKNRPDLLAALDGVGHLHIGTDDIVQNVRRRLEEYAEVVDEIAGAATGARRLPDGTFALEVPGAGALGLRARAMIIATGVMDRQPSIARLKDGRLLDATHWVYPFANTETFLYCLRCEGHLTRGRRVAVIGGSETAAQIALMLAERYGSACCVLGNGEPVVIEDRTRRLMEHYGISVHPGRLVEVLGGEGAARADLRGFVLEEGTRVTVDFAFVSLGLYRVYNDLARDLGAALTDEALPEEIRHVRIDARGETSVPGLFAVGDVAARVGEPVMKQIYTAQEYAVRAVDTIDWRRRARLRNEILSEPARAADGGNA